MKKIYVVFFFCVSAIFSKAATYYFISGDPTAPANWNTVADGSGTAATAFNGAGDIFIIPSGKTAIQTSIWYFQIISGYSSYANGANGASTLVASYTGGASNGMYVYSTTAVASGTTISSINTTTNSVGLSAALTAATSVQQTIYISSAAGTTGTNTITFTTIPATLAVGMTVSGAGVPSSPTTTITAISGNTATLSANLTATIATPLTFYPSGVTSASNTLQIQSGGTLIQQAPILGLGTFKVDNGGTFKFNFPHGKGATGDYPNSTTKIFGASSSLEINCWSDGTNINGASTASFLPSNVTLGNVTINLSSSGIITDAANASNTNFPWGKNLFLTNTSTTTVTQSFFSSTNTSIAGSLTVTSLGSSTVNVSALTLNSSPGITTTITGNLTVTSPNGTVGLMNNSGETMNIGGDLVLNAATNNTLGNLQGITSNGAGSTINVTGNVNIQSGTFIICKSNNLQSTFTVGGNCTISTANAVNGFGTNPGSLKWTITGNYTQSAGSVTLSSGSNNYTTFTVNGNVAINAGSFILNVNNLFIPVNVSGDLTVASGATFTFNSGTSNRPYRVKVGGNLNFASGSNLTAGGATQAMFIFTGGTNASPTCTIASNNSNVQPGIIAETGKTVTINNSYTVGASANAQQTGVFAAGGNIKLASGVTLTMPQFNHVVATGGYIDCGVDGQIIGTGTTAGSFINSGANSITATLAANYPVSNAYTVNISTLTGIQKGMIVSGEGVPTNTYVAHNASTTSFYTTEPISAVGSCGNQPVTSITVTNGGTGYTSAPTVVISGGVGATAVATVSGGSVTGVTITNNGYSYSAVPVVTFIGGGGSGATATAAIGVNTTVGCAVTYGGSNYTSSSTVNVVLSGGTNTVPATGTATVVNGSITGIVMTNTGTYTAGSYPTSVLFIPTNTNLTLASSIGTLKTGNVNGIGGSISSSTNLTRTFNATANYEFNGTQPQVTTDLPPTVGNLTINNAAGVTLSSGATITNALNINAGSLTTGANNLVLTASTGSATLVPGTSLIISGGTTNFNNQLVTLQSNASGAASIGQIAGNVSNATNITVQQYITAKRAYRFLGHPFNSGISLSQLTPTIDITGGTSTGFTSTATNSPSAYWFNTATSDGASGTDAGWTAFTDLTQTTGTNAWNKYQGINVLIRGTKGTGLTGGAYSPAAVTLSINGTINKGAQTILLNSTIGWNLISNPYPSAVNLAGPLTGFSGVYVWNATAAGSNGRGAYQAVPGGTSSSILPMGSAFMVQSSAASQTLTFNESDKSTASPISLFGANDFLGNKIGVQLDVLQNGDYYDRLFVFAEKNATTGKDVYDLEKFLNPDLSIYSTATDGAKLAIDSRYFNGKITVPVSVDTKLQNTFTIGFTAVNMPNSKLYLHDKLKDVFVEITKGNEYSFDVTADAATQGNRFEITNYTKSTLNAGIDNANTELVEMYAGNGVFVIKYNNPVPIQTDVRVVNISGVPVYTKDLGVQQQGQLQISTSNFSKGIYVVEMQIGNKKITKKLLNN
jgi:hypothetical protein